MIVYIIFFNIHREKLANRHGLLVFRVNNAVCVQSVNEISSSESVLSDLKCLHCTLVFSSPIYRSLLRIRNRNVLFGLSFNGLCPQGYTIL